MLYILKNPHHLLLSALGLFEGVHDGGSLHHVLGAEVGELGAPQQALRHSL